MITSLAKESTPTGEPADEDDLLEVEETPNVVDIPETERKRLGQEIIEDHTVIKRSAKDVFGHAVSAGRKLEQIKSSLNHGEYMGYIETHFPFSVRTANLYRSLARHEVFARGKLATVAGLVTEEMGLVAAHKRLGELHDEAIHLTDELREAILLLGYAKISPEEFSACVEDLEASTLKEAVDFIGQILLPEPNKVSS